MTMIDSRSPLSLTPSLARTADVAGILADPQVSPEPAAPKPATSAVKVYPFRSKKQIVALIAADDGFACECLGVMYARQTAYEQEATTTQDRNHRGFMSSHAVTGSTLAKKFLAGEPLSEEEMAKTRTIASRYGRQLAEHFRMEDIARDPSLGDAAAVFFGG